MCRAQVNTANFLARGLRHRYAGWGHVYNPAYTMICKLPKRFLVREEG